MGWCEGCKREFEEERMAVEVRFGYVDPPEADDAASFQWERFTTDSSYAPLCEDCAIACIPGDINL